MKEAGKFKVGGEGTKVGGGGGGGEKRSVHALKNWVMSVLELYGAQQSVVKGCCEYGNERRDSENFLIIFMSIIFSRNALCHRTAYQVQK